MCDFIRLPGSIINLSHIRLIEFEGDVVLVHWANHRQHLVLRGADAGALLNALEDRYGILSSPSAQFWQGSDHCTNATELDNIFSNDLDEEAA